MVSGSNFGSKDKRVLGIVLEYYVYALFRPWDGSPFYIGKGKNKRWKQLNPASRKNRHFLRIVAKAERLELEIPAIKIREGLTSEEACQIEIALIAAIGRGKNGPLVNLTDGGEGAKGFRHSPKTCATMSRKGKGRPKSPEHVAAMRAGLLAYFANLPDEKREARNKAIQAGTLEAMAAPSVRKKISVAAAKRPPQTPEHRARNSHSLKLAHVRNPQWRVAAVDAMNKSSKNSGNKHSAETRQRMSLSQRANAAARAAAKAAEASNGVL